MALTNGDLQGLIGLFEEWVADPSFAMTLEVREKRPQAKMVYGGLAARVTTDTYCQVRVYKDEICVFSEPVAYDLEHLRVSVTVLAKVLAAKADGLAERQADE